MLTQKKYFMDDHVFEENDKEDRFTHSDDREDGPLVAKKKHGLGIFFII